MFAKLRRVLDALDRWGADVHDRWELSRMIVAPPRSSLGFEMASECSCPCTRTVKNRECPRIAWAIEGHTDHSAHATKLHPKDLARFQNRKSYRFVEARKSILRGFEMHHPTLSTRAVLRRLKSRSLFGKGER